MPSSSASPCSTSPCHPRWRPQRQQPRSARRLTGGSASSHSSLNGIEGLIMSARGMPHSWMMTEMTGPGVEQVKWLLGVITGATAEMDAPSLVGKSP